MAVSGLGIIALLVHKRLELSRGVSYARVQEVREKTDPILANINRTTGRFFSYVNLHNTVLFLNYIFVHVVKFFMDTSHKIHKASSAMVEKASKRTEDLSKGGAASFYLKQIKEIKDSATELK